MISIQEDYLTRENKLSSQLVELRDTQSRSQQKLEMKQKELSDKQQQLADTSRQLKKIGSSGAVIDQIELELRKDVRNRSTHTLLTDSLSLIGTRAIRVQVQCQYLSNGARAAGSTHSKEATRSVNADPAA